MGEKQEYSYVFQSGKHKGMSVGAVFLANPVSLARIYQNSFRDRKSVRNPNQLQLAIESLLEKIKTLEITRICSYCKQRSVSSFLLPDSGVISNKLLCCDDPECKAQLKSARTGSLHAINDFMLLISYVPKPEARKILSIFATTHKNYQEQFVS